jgi:hypothetical protein
MTLEFYRFQDRCALDKKSCIIQRSIRCIWSRLEVYYSEDGTESWVN